MRMQISSSTIRKTPRLTTPLPVAKQLIQSTAQKTTTAPKPPSTTDKLIPSPEIAKVPSVLLPSANNSPNSAFKPQIVNLSIPSLLSLKGKTNLLPLISPEEFESPIFSLREKIAEDQVFKLLKEIIAQDKGKPRLEVGILFPALEVSRYNQRRDNVNYQLIALQTQIKTLEAQTQDLSKEIKLLNSQLALKASKKGFFDFLPPFYLSLFNDQLKVSFGAHPTEFDLLLQKRLGNLTLSLIDTQNSILHKRTQQTNLESEKAEIESLIPRFSALANIKKKYDKGAMQLQANRVAQREQIRAEIKKLEDLPNTYSRELKKLIAALEKINKKLLLNIPPEAIKTGNLRSPDDIAERQRLQVDIAKLQAMLEKTSGEFNKLVTDLAEINKKLPDLSIIEAGDFNSQKYFEAVEDVKAVQNLIKKN